MARIMPMVFMFGVWERKRLDLHLGVKSLTEEGLCCSKISFTYKNR